MLIYYFIGLSFCFIVEGFYLEVEWSMIENFLFRLLSGGFLYRGGEVCGFSEFCSFLVIRLVLYFIFELYLGYLVGVSDSFY